MGTTKTTLTTRELPHFDRSKFGSSEPLSSIGEGYIGGKAAGLLAAYRVLKTHFPTGEYQGIRVSVPSMVVLGTDVFDAFMAANKLYDVVAEGLPDERLAAAFQKSDFPYVIIGDLRSLIQGVTAPLAIRSSSLLEDASANPFAGVYATKMIPNNQPDADTRFKKLIEAIKFVYASTFFKDAAGYRKMIESDLGEEKMAVIVQEIVGLRHDERFYPTIAGVTRSYNFYPSGAAKPEEGVVDLALGLGKTIVDGGRSWTYSPAHPNNDPPGTIRDFLQQTQTEFWAVNMGSPPAFDPLLETEYLISAELAEAEYDGTLAAVASTYDAANDRLVLGISRAGARIVNFAPTIRMPDIPLNALIRELLKASEAGLGCEVEIEFAVMIDPLRRQPPWLGFLQVRPIVISRELIEVSDEAMNDPKAILASERVMGHGVLDSIQDIVYVIPEKFQKDKTRIVAQEIAVINRDLQAQKRQCILMTFGRLGSTDPWLGVPVDWGEISQAKVIVEATMPDMDVELSQGSHFFHNMTSLRICYFSMHHAGKYGIAYDKLAAHPAEHELQYVRHIRLQTPAVVRVDGRNGRGVIRL